MKTKFFQVVSGKIKEALRKLAVSLKRNPKLIPLLALAISFVYYSFNLTYISKTTLLINTSFMGLCSFATMLFSILSFICMLNAFPKRQKPNAFMLTLLLGMTAIIIFCDAFYYSSILNSTVQITSQRAFVTVAKRVVFNHIIFMSVTALLTVTEPIIAKLLKKINTSIDTEYTSTMEAIDISDEE